MKELTQTLRSVMKRPLNVHRGPTTVCLKYGLGKRQIYSCSENELRIILLQGQKYLNLSHCTLVNNDKQTADVSKKQHSERLNIMTMTTFNSQDQVIQKNSPCFNHSVGEDSIQAVNDLRKTALKQESE